MSTLFPSGLLAVTFSLPEQFVERLGWVLVHTLWQFTLMAWLAEVATKTLRQSAEMRYRVLVGALALSVALPVATWFSLSTPIHDNASDLAFAADQPAHSPVAMPDGAPLDSRPTPSSAVNPPPTSLPLWLRVQWSLQPCLKWLVDVWVAGVLVCSLRPLLGWHTLRRFRHTGISPPPDELRVAVARLSQRLGLRRSVQVWQSTLARVPLLIGYARPLVLLPMSVITNLSAPELEAILAHELMHVRRHDFLVNMLQTLIETLFFYHPGLWRLSQQIRIEREHCCDDLVVATFDNRVEYGRALLALEELRGRGALLALGAADGSLVARVRRILGNKSHDRPYSPVYSWPALLLGLSLALMICHAAFAVDGDGKDLLMNAAAHAGDKEIRNGEFQYKLFVEKQPPTKEMIAKRVEEVRNGLRQQVERVGDNEDLRQRYQKAIANANEYVEPQVLEQASRTMKFHFLLGVSTAGEDQWCAERSILDKKTQRFRPPKTVMQRTLTGHKHLALFTENELSTSNPHRQLAVISPGGVYPGSQDPRRLGRLMGFLDTPNGRELIDFATNIKVSRVEGAQNGSLREVTCSFDPRQKPIVTVRCQIDPSRGYITPLIQEIDDKGRLMQEWVCEDYFRATGTDLWFPEKCVYRTMSEAGAGLTDMERYEFSQDGVMLNIEIPAKRFAVKLHPKDNLLDSNGKESTDYSVAKELQISLDDLDDIKTIEGLKIEKIGGLKADGSP